MAERQSGRRIVVARIMILVEHGLQHSTQHIIVKRDRCNDSICFLASLQIIMNAVNGSRLQRSCQPTHSNSGKSFEIIGKALMGNGEWLQTDIEQLPIDIYIYIYV